MNLRSDGVRRAAIVVFLVATCASALVGYRTYRSFQLLQSAYEVGAPRTSSLRGWMTLRYVSTTYQVPETVLREGLAIPPGGSADRSLKALADEAGASPPDYVRRAQRVIARHAPAGDAGREAAASGWFAAVGERVLTWLLTSGYVALGLTLLLGAFGVPLPTGIAMALAGSLAAQGRMDLIAAGGTAVIASVLGDLAGYGLGRVLSQRFLEKRGRWIGYTPARHASVRALFDRWGLLTVFITRTFASSLSSIANLFAGVSRLRAVAFVAVAILGRVAWTAAYMGLGYLVGGDLDAASGFLTNLSLVLLILAVVAGSGVLAFRRPVAAV